MTAVITIGYIELPSLYKHYLIVYIDYCKMSVISLNSYLKHNEAIMLVYANIF